MPSASSVGRPCIGSRSVMSYSSPSGSRNFPALSPATAARTVRSTSTGATPSSAAFCESMLRSRSVRRRRTGLSTSRVPGTASIRVSACAASARSCSRSGPDDRDLDRCVDRRSVLERLDQDPRAGVLGELRPQLLVEHGTAARVEALEFGEHLGDVRVGLGRVDVVVDARVAAAEVGEPVLHLRTPGEFFLDVAQCPVRVGEARPVRRLDRDAELRNVGIGEQAEADQRHQRERAERRRPSRRPWSRRGPRERPLQRRHVTAADRARQRLQRPAAVAGLAFALQQPAREERDHRERHEQRGEHRVQHGRRQRADEDAGAFRAGTATAGTRTAASPCSRRTASAIWSVAAIAASTRE